MIGNYFIPTLLKKGNKIHIKKSNKGKFTKYCNGKVSQECIDKGKNSPDPKIRKQAVFAENARSWKHQDGGLVKINGGNNVMSPEDFYKQQQLKLNDYTNLITQQQLKKLQEQLQAIQNTLNVVNNATSKALDFGMNLAQDLSMKRVDKKLNNLSTEDINDLNNGTKSLADVGINSFGRQYAANLFLASQGQFVKDPNKSEAENALAELDFENEQNNKRRLLTRSKNTRAFNNAADQANNPQQQTNVAPAAKHGKKLIKKHSTHRTKSILDSVGLINEKTLKLK